MIPFQKPKEKKIVYDRKTKFVFSASKKKEEKFNTHSTLKWDQLKCNISDNFHPFKNYYKKMSINYERHSDNGSR